MEHPMPSGRIVKGTAAHDALWRDINNRNELDGPVHMIFARELLAKVLALHVAVDRMDESNGRSTWIVNLCTSPEQPVTDRFSVYTSASEGRARYYAAELQHFLGQGPKPDMLAFDTDLPAAAAPWVPLTVETLPSYEASAHAVAAQTATALHRFIESEEPVEPDHEREFRQRLVDALNEAAGFGAQVAG